MLVSGSFNRGKLLLLLSDVPAQELEAKASPESQAAQQSEFGATGGLATETADSGALAVRPRDECRSIFVLSCNRTISHDFLNRSLLILSQSRDMYTVATPIDWTPFLSP